MSTQNPKEMYSGRDAAPAVLHGVQDANSRKAYPILVDPHGIEYNTSGTQKYIGYNDRGKSETTDTDWLLHFLEYDATKRIIKRTIAYDSWDNRSTASYA